VPVSFTMKSFKDSSNTDHARPSVCPHSLAGELQNEFL
jgi:hypothetical protein